MDVSLCCVLEMMSDPCAQSLSVPCYGCGAGAAELRQAKARPVKLPLFRCISVCASPLRLACHSALLLWFIVASQLSSDLEGDRQTEPIRILSLILITGRLAWWPSILFPPTLLSSRFLFLFPYLCVCPTPPEGPTNPPTVYSIQHVSPPPHAPLLLTLTANPRFCPDPLHMRLIYR